MRSLQRNGLRAAAADYSPDRLCGSKSYGQPPVSPDKEVENMSTISTPEARFRPQRSSAVLITILIFGAIVSTFEATMMYTALPGIIEQFKTTPGHAGWILTGFALVGAASAAISGRLGDAYGRRNVLIVLLLASTAGSAVCLIGNSLESLIIGRAVQGLAGGIVPLAIGILRENLTRKNLSFGVACVVGSSMVGGSAGNLIAGNIYDAWGWHKIFVVSLVLAAFTAAISLFLPAPAARTGLVKVDWLGGVLFAPGIASILYAITESSTWGWGNGKTLAFLLGGIVLLAAWVAWELTTDEPLLNIRYCANRKVGLTLLAAALISIGTLGMSGFVGQLIMQMPKIAPVGLGLSAGKAGDISFFCGLTGIIFAPLAGRIARGGRARAAFLIGAVFALLAAIATATLLGSLPGFIFSQLVLTVATGFLLTSMPNLIVEGVSAAHTSEVAGIYQVVQNSFIGVGTSVGTVLLSNHLVHGTPLYARTGYNEIFLLMGAAAVAAFVIGLFQRHGSVAEETEEGREAKLEAYAEALAIKPETV
jgi:MFS family permease